MTDPMNPLGEYRFVSWVRRGIAAALTHQAGPLPARATLTAGVNLQATPVSGGSAAGSSGALSVSVPVALYGPGDVSLIDTFHFHTEPADGTANFEPNYLAAIEIDIPDFPWWHTPTGPADGRLQPWIVLITLAAGEFDPPADSSGTHPSSRKPPVIGVHDITVLPDLSESWAWAHAQVGVDLTQSGVDVPAVLASHPEVVSSRLICPRQLAPDTAYTAFLVPAFDVGVQAGLGQPVSSTATAGPAWSAQTPTPLLLPVYHQFSFHTSNQGDFESLVRRMQPRVLAPDVGLRPMDVSQPDPWDVGPASSSPLGMGGALRAIDTTDTVWPDPKDQNGATFQANLTSRVNSTSPIQDDPATPGKDPTVMPPLYGRWLAAQPTLPATGWVNDLNLDPRRRAAAGLGSQVVTQERTQLMAGAWAQVAGVEQANQLLRQGQLARTALTQVSAKHFTPAPIETLLALTAPLHGRVLASPTTVRATLAASRLPALALSAAFRRVTRPLGPVRARQGTGPVAPYHLLARLNAGHISAAPPLRAPRGMPAIDDISNELYPPNLPGWLRRLLPYAPWLVLAIGLVLALVILVVGLLTGWPALAVALAVAVIALAVILAILLWKVARKAAAAQRMRFAALTAHAIRQVPPQPGFAVVPSGQPLPSGPGSGPDSADAHAFRAAASQVAAVMHAPAANPPPLPSADLAALRDALLTRLDPAVTVSERIAAMVHVDPALGWAYPADPLEPVMAAPSFPQPMYVPMRDISQDWVLPNIGSVPPDTLAVLHADHAFIEAYMVGLNQAMGRQLLWNHYHTDQRGTYFRQFWDVSSYVPVQGDPPPGSPALQEKLYDIPPIAATPANPGWPIGTPLGQHDNRGIAGDNLVLLLRGELLRRYPDAVIYAKPAAAGTTKNEPALVLDPTAPELYPLYRGTLAPDLTFFGFALTAAQARGDATHPLGWFFVFQQRPGQARFGLEPSPPTDLNGKWLRVTQWATLSWMNFASRTGVTPAFLSPGTTPYDVDANGAPDPTKPITPVVETDRSGIQINPKDPNNSWGADAAQTAYITMRLPARVAVHADLLLPCPQLTGLTVTPASGQAPFAASFAASVANPAAVAGSYQWDFGDGSNAQTTTASTTHSYQMPGTYTATVTTGVPPGCPAANSSATVTVTSAGGA
jgi:PKD domain